MEVKWYQKDHIVLPLIFIMALFPVLLWVSGFL